MCHDSLLAKELAPEEVRKGDFVQLLYDVHEFLPFWALTDRYADVTLLRIQTLPCGEQTPLKVVAVCLPFIAVKTVERKHKTLDLRACRIARVSERYARLVFRHAKAGKAEKPVPVEKEE